METKELRFETLAAGAGLEMVNDALAALVEDLANPNADDEASRSVTLVVKIVPDRKARGKRADVQVDCRVKLAGRPAVGSVVFLAQTRDGLRAYEHDPGQLELPMEPGLQIVPGKGGA